MVHALASALRESPGAEHGVPALRSVGAWARRPERLRRLALPALDFDELVACDILVLAVRDDAISELSDRVAEYELREDQLVLHCSGACGLEAFSSLRGLEAALAILHPLRSLPGHGEHPLRRARCVLHGMERARVGLEGFARALGLRATWVSELDTAMYHAACALASNGVTALLDAASDLLAEASDGRLALSEARELAGSALAAFEVSGVQPEDVLTGPVARGELAVVREHMAALAPSPASELYAATMRRALDIAERAGLARDLAKRIARALDGGER